ncbi:MAG: Ig-like domain-containing protein, partial [Candidatus Marinimicrobia bacterium]|nr:Ig-like domain-containing protein [Candidatus Neomarinimicrobiota bacterium]
MDFIKVVYSEAISDASVAAGDFQTGIANTTAGNLTETFASLTPGSGNETDVANDATIYIGVSNGTESISANKTDYTLKIEQVGAISDASANSLASFAVKTSTDGASPVVVTFSPADNATGVGVNDNMILTFDEVVDVETGNITLKKTVGDVLVEAMAVGSANVTGTGTTTITIDPTANLESQIEYYVLIDATAFDDPAGNSYAGITSTTAWSFTAADVTAPTFAATYPKSSNVAGTTLDLLMKIDEGGAGYFVVLADGAGAPSSAQVKAGTDASDGALAANLKGSQALVANVEAAKAITGLTSETA